LDSGYCQPGERARRSWQTEETVQKKRAIRYAQFGYQAKVKAKFFRRTS
jgi:hypothetical protein